MTLPSRFQKEVHTHLSRNPQYSHGESFFIFISLVQQGRKLGPVPMKQNILTMKDLEHLYRLL